MIDLDMATELIARFEGFVDHVYDDGTGTFTVGYGEIDPSILARYFNGITEAEARALLRERVQQFADAVESCVSRPMSGNQHAAFTSLAYNIGVGAFCGSSACRLFNAGDVSAAGDAIAMWNKAGGRTLEGLVRRRTAEIDLFLTPDSVPEDEDFDDLMAVD